MGVPSLVLFDLDETLFDHQHSSRTALAHLRERHPVLARVELVELEAQAREILDRVHEAVVRGRMNPAEARLERLRLLFGNNGSRPSDDFLHRTVSEYGAVYRGSRRAVPGSAPLLRWLRQHRSIRSVAVVTNHLAAVQRDKLEACQLADLVDFMVTSEEVGHLKPAPEVFRAALDRAGVPASGAVMVGDSWDSDIRGAAEIGMRAVWFNPKGMPMPETPEAQSIRELPSFEPLEAACRVILSA